MHKFITSLTPEQLALVAGVVSPYVHFLITSVVKFKDTHKDLVNWTLSFVLPLVATLATYLATNPTFNHLVPLYATVYTAGQLVYLASVRYIKKYQDLTKPVENQQF